MSEPLDLDARTRIATSIEDRNLFVEAGAGTGKTTTMVKRLVETIGTGDARIDQIVAITFTDAAAGELRERLRIGLEKARSDDQRSEQFVERCTMARKDIDKGIITTIHGFASRLLAMYPAQVGLPFEFEVMDDIALKLHQDKRWRRFLARTYGSREGTDDKIKQLLHTGILLGITHQRVKKLFGKFDDGWQNLAEVAKQTQRLAPPIDVTELRHRALELQSELALCRDPFDTLAVLFESKLSPLVEGLKRFADLDRTGKFEVLLQPLGSVTKKGDKKKWGTDDECVADVRAKWVEVEDLRKSVVNSQMQWCSAEISRMVAEEVVEAANERRHLGQCTYHDLLVLAVELVRDNRSVRQELRQTFTRLFVDEFQDTDALQVELVSLLTNPAEPQPTALCTVGDPRQSIYRFRNAEPELFAQVRDSNDSNNIVRLSSNFRTQSPIIGWVNECFVNLFEGQSGITTAELTAERTDNCASAFTLGLDTGYSSVDECREAEATAVADLCRKARDEGWPVVAGGGIRGAHYRDIAIVYPRRNSVDHIQRALRKLGVPYRIEGREPFWKSQEAVDLLNLVAAIADPLDSISVVGVLRSIAFGCTDQDLYDWKASGGSWDYRKVRTNVVTGRVADRAAGEVESVDTVATSLATLARLHSVIHFVTTAEIVDRAVSQIQYFEKLFALHRPRDAWARARCFLDFARAWDLDSDTGLVGFVDWAKTQREEGISDVVSINPDPDDDAVRMMTVHASKGLEFPVVFAVGMGTLPRSSDPVDVLWGKKKEPYVKFGKDLEASGFEVLAEQEKIDSLQEDIRLAYVALTRAKDHLVVSLHRTKPPEKGTTLTLAERIARTVKEQQIQDVLPVSVGPSPDLPVVAPRQSSIDFPTVLSQGSARIALSGTATAKLFGVKRKLQPRWHADPSKADAAKRFGSAVHKAMELQPIDAPVNDSFCELAATEYKIPERVAEIRRSVEHALGSSIAQEAATLPHWKELSMVGPAAGTVLHGQADLIFERSDGLVVVDWKTDFLEDDQHGSDLLAYYKWQLITYSAVLTEAVGKPVVEAAICLISPLADTAQVLRIDHVGSAINELRFELEAFRDAQLVH